MESSIPHSFCEVDPELKFRASGERLACSFISSGSSFLPFFLPSFPSSFLPSLLPFLLFRAAPLAYGGSQTRGQIGAVATGLHHSQSNTGSESNLPPHHSSWQRSLTHRESSGIEPALSWILVGFVNHQATMGTPLISLSEATAVGPDSQATSFQPH